MNPFFFELSLNNFVVHVGADQHFDDDGAASVVAPTDQKFRAAYDRVGKIDFPFERSGELVEQFEFVL